MLNKLLLIISVVLILLSDMRIILMYRKTKNIKIDDMTGFDLAKELTSNYDEINIVESREVSISKYNLKRRIIKLNYKDYTMNNIFTLTKSSLLAGYSLVALNKDKNIEILGKIFNNIDYLNKSSIVTILISCLVKAKGDAKIALILLSLILIYQYIINEININSKEQTKEQLKDLLEEKNYLLLDDIKNSYLNLNKISFITTLILILRLVLIIIN